MRTAPLATAPLAPLLLTAALALGCGGYVPADQVGAGGGGGGGKLGDLPGSGGLVRPRTLDHARLARVMRRHVSRAADGDAVLVDYVALSRDRSALDDLALYLAQVAGVDPSHLATPAERLAYWVNAYNAAVVAGVVEAFGGRRSYRVIDSGRFFSDARRVYGGVRLSLDMVEHGVVRGVKRSPDPKIQRIVDQWHRELWGGKRPDPRIHAIFNCAAASCPNLLDREPFVYRARELEAQMARATREWLASPKKGGNRQGISRLFDWYGEDFGGTRAAKEAFIRRHRPGGLAGLDTGRYLTYDWTLNIK